MSDRIQAIVMPKLGLSMTEGMVTKWYVSNGSKVQAGEILADIETSKITNELEAFSPGIIRGDLAEEGIDLPVGTLLGLIVTEDVSNEEIREFIDGFDQTSIEDPGIAIQNEASVPSTTRHSKPATTVGAASQGIIVPVSLGGSFETEQIHATHLAKKLAAKHNIDLGKVEGTGRRGRISIADIQTAILSQGGTWNTDLAHSSGPAKSVAGSPQISATPLARKMATQNKIDLNLITPSGRNGRITRSDVEEFIRNHMAQSSSNIPELPDHGDFEEIPISTMRKRIGQRMSESVNTAPHFRLSIDVNIDRLLALRKSINTDDPDIRISINDLLIRACAKSLLEVPEINCQYDGYSLKRFTHADIAVAVAIDDGLITPIVRKANTYDIRSLSEKVENLIIRAKTGRLMPDDILGGTFTISNLGMFGITSFDAIINPPQIAILAIGQVERKMVEIDSRPEFVNIMNMTLSCDHRVLDGAIGAKFLSCLKKYLENPSEMI